MRDGPPASRIPKYRNLELKFYMNMLLVMGATLELRVVVTREVGCRLQI